MEAFCSYRAESISYLSFYFYYFVIFVLLVVFFSILVLFCFIHVVAVVSLAL